MKKKLFALSGVFLIALVITGLWATKAISFTDGGNAIQEDPTGAASQGEASLRQMAREAEVIAHVKCLETKGVWVNRDVHTLATVSRQAVIKGDDVPETFTVVLPGGVPINQPNPKIRFGRNYPGAPGLQTDEEAVLFLTRDADLNGYVVTNYSEGKYTVNQNTDGVKVVMRDVVHVPVPGGHGVMRDKAQGVPLSEFMALVTEYLR